MIRFYYIFLLLFCVYLPNVSISDEGEEVENLHRIKRLLPPMTTLNDSSTTVSSIIIPTPIVMMNTVLNMSPIYVITNQNPPLTTTQTTTTVTTTTTTQTTTTTTQTTTTTTQTTTTTTTSQTTTTTTQTSSSTSQTSSTTSTVETTTTTTTGTVSSTTISYNPDTCFNSTYIKLFNGTCVTKAEAQIIAVELLRNSFNNDTNTAYALSLYISSITNSTRPFNQTNTLSIAEIDEIIDDMINVDITLNSNTSFITFQNPQHDDNTIILGASFKRGIGGEIVDTINKINITQSFLSAAAIIDESALSGVLSLNLLIIDKPTGYENIDKFTGKTVVSSVIVGNLRWNSSNHNPITISLYFNPLLDYQQNGSGEYLCSFYNTNISQWDEYGCTNPKYNDQFTRYECNCSHLTSFALVWLPESLLKRNATKNFEAQDFASIIAQSISIICFLIIIIHAIIIKIHNPIQRLQTLKFLPLISTASTTILFIFYIALTLTVYTQTPSSDTTECFLSSKILMYITYFFLIFMFCVKTSAGYFYYLRFVRLFPQPSHRQLLSMLIISFIISCICVSLVIGFSTNSIYNIIQLYPYKICWFQTNIIYYFLTIPIGIFLFINLVTICLIARSIFIHALHGVTKKQKSERLKRSVIVLLSSCVTQGIGWLLGPFITFTNPIGGIILGWIFIILNGFEGFWSIILYLFIRQQQIDEQKHVAAAIKLTKSTGLSSNKNVYKKNFIQPIEKRFDKGRLNSFNDIRRRDIDFPDDDNIDRVF